MNATKFVVILLIGVVCANVGAKQLEEVSKETKLSISSPKATAQGIGAVLSVQGSTSSSTGSFTNAIANNGPSGSEASTFGSASNFNFGSISADAPNADASSSSSGGANSGSGAIAGPGGANSGSSGSSGGGSFVDGSTGTSPSP